MLRRYAFAVILPARDGNGRRFLAVIFELPPAAADYADATFRQLIFAAVIFADAAMPPLPFIDAAAAAADAFFAPSMFVYC